MIVGEIRRYLRDNSAVRVSRSDDNDTVIIELAVAPEDLGKVIGKQGRTARAMRSLLAALATRENRRSRLEIVE